MRQNIWPFIDLSRDLEDTFDIASDLDTILRMHCPCAVRRHLCFLSAQYQLNAPEPIITLWCIEDCMIVVTVSLSVVHSREETPRATVYLIHK